MSDDAAARLLGIMAEMPLAGWNLHVETPGVAATAPMMRGVWGLALRELDRRVYDIVFEGRRADADTVPLYVLRPSPAVEGRAGAGIDVILFGEAIGHAGILWRAWDRASGLGLGGQRRPFRIVGAAALRPTRPGAAPADGGAPSPPDAPVSLADLAAASDAATAPASLQTMSPLRLLRGGRLVTRPDPPALARAALNRMKALWPQHAQRIDDAEAGIAALAARLPAGPWQGGRAVVSRYSGRQKREVHLLGIDGTLSLPRGCQGLAPLFAAIDWMHIGRGTVFGMGRLTCRPATGLAEAPRP